MRYPEQANSQRQEGKQWSPGAGGGGGDRGFIVLVLQDERILEMDDSGTVTLMSLMPLNCTLNGQDDKFCVFYHN